MANAIHPDHFKDFRELAVKKEATTADEAEQEEKLIADLSYLGGWTYLKKYILDLNDILDGLVKSSMEAGATYEEIGRKTIVAEIAKSYLLRVIEKVENARTALESSTK